MSKEKLYFKDVNDTFCTSLKTRLEDARLDGLKKITLIEAIPDDITSEYVWCTHEGEVSEKDMCRKSECELYSSKSGRGVCEHRGKLYLHGEEVTFDVPQDEIEICYKTNEPCKFNCKGLCRESF